MDRKELDSKLRQLVINAFRTIENVHNDSPLDVVDEASGALTAEIISIEDWVMAQISNK